VTVDKATVTVTGTQVLLTAAASLAGVLVIGLTEVAAPAPPFCSPASTDAATLADSGVVTCSVIEAVAVEVCLIVVVTTLVEDPLPRV
jgi:hypothetical protein